jgi:hypothetical protein
MRHTIHQDPVTHKFALIGLPPRLIDRDKLPIPTVSEGSTPARRPWLLYRSC